ncbi:MAG: hypothetical protein EOP36_17220, partial [Rubrivivax sp.]
AFMSGRGGSFQFNLAKDVTDALRAQAQQQGRTLYITLLAAYALALHRVSQQDDFVIGTPVRGREQPALEPLMGFFVNMLPLRMRPQADMSLPSWLAAVHRQVVDAFSFPDVPFDHLVQALQVPRDLSRPPVHQVSFSYQDVRERTTRWGNVDHQRMPTPMLGAAQDLALWCVETRNHIEFVFTFNADVLDTATVGVFAASLEKLLRQIVTDPHRPLAGYDLSPDRKDAPAPAPLPSPPANLSELLRQRAHAASTTTALSQTGERPLSHAELWSQAHRVSHFLRAQGLGRGQVVGVCMPRRPELVTAILGILQSGAACVALDPLDPGEHTGVNWVIGRSDTVQALSWPRDKTLLMDLDERLLRAQADTPLAPDANRDARGDDPAAWISTSGSSGQARRVSLSHAGLINLLLGLAQKPGLNPGQRLLAASPVGTGQSLVDFFWPLLVGAEVVLCPADASRDPRLLAAQLDDDIHLMQATPGTWQALVDAGWKGHGAFVALSGGAPLSASLASQLLARCAAVWNLYGQAEASVWSTCWRVDHPERGVRIGRPIGNTRIQVIDAQGQPCPTGTPGEICLGGADTPTLHHTGDLGQWHDSGDLDHLGRLAPSRPAGPDGVPATTTPASTKPAPSTPLEKAIAEVWQELIGESDIGLNDNFFDLGGHSLLAMRAVTEIRRRTGVNVGVRRLIFETLGQLAAPEAAKAQEGAPPEAPTATGDNPVAAKGGWINRLLGR